MVELAVVTAWAERALRAMCIVALASFLAYPLVTALVGYVNLPFLTPEARRVAFVYLHFGPSGQYCLDDEGFAYDPQREEPPWFFLRERPEQALMANLNLAAATAHRVRVYPNAGRATVWMRGAAPDEPEQLTPYELRGQGSTFDLEVNGAIVGACTVELGNWRMTEPPSPGRASAGS